MYETAWVTDTPVNRKNFERLVVAGRHRYGIDSHWLEERHAAQEPRRGSLANGPVP